MKGISDFRIVVTLFWILLFNNPLESEQLTNFWYNLNYLLNLNLLYKMAFLYSNKFVLIIINIRSLKQKYLIYNVVGSKDSLLHSLTLNIKLINS